jgi:uncharacterized protein with HEPN domain
MRRSFEAYLWDIQDAAKDILRFTWGQTIEDYSTNPLVRAAVERKFEIIGEALTQAKHHFPSLVADIDDVSKVIAFRNQLVHNYDDINTMQVWQIISESLPHLLAQVTSLMGPPIE